MTLVHARRDLTSLDALAGERVAVVGYGVQGRAQALSLRDSGVDVCVGNRDDEFAERARADGFEVLSIPEAAAGANLVLFLSPDEAQPLVYAPPPSSPGTNATT